jgi:hypothetical protein
MNKIGVIPALLAAFAPASLSAPAAEHIFGITPYPAYHYFNDRFNDDNYKDTFEEEGADSIGHHRLLFNSV